MDIPGIVEGGDISCNELMRFQSSSNEQGGSEENAQNWINCHKWLHFIWGNNILRLAMVAQARSLAQYC
jgi:hypothetical protein